MFNEGLRHLPQKIFGYLDRKSLLASRDVCLDWQQFVDDPDQEWRKPWIQKLESALDTTIYTEQTHGMFWYRLEVSVFDFNSCLEQGNDCHRCLDWKDICRYYRYGSLRDLVVFTECMDEMQKKAKRKRFPKPVEPIEDALTLPFSQYFNFFKTLLCGPVIPREFCKPFGTYANILHFACEYGSDAELLELVLEKIYQKKLKIDVNEKSCDGRTALDILVRSYRYFVYRKSLDIMLAYAKRLGMLTNIPDKSGLTPFQNFLTCFRRVKIADVDLWIDQPVEFNTDSFKLMYPSNLLGILQDLFEEEGENGDSTKTFLEKIGNPTLTKEGKIDIKHCLLQREFGPDEMAPIVAELCQERRNAYMERNGSLKIKPCKVILEKMDL